VCVRIQCNPPATHCKTLQRTATHCNKPQLTLHTVVLAGSLQLTCNTLQHTATHTAPNCNSHCILLCWRVHCNSHATHCNILQHTLHQTATHTAYCCVGAFTATHMQHTQTRTAMHCNTLQHTAPHCNTLQHTATHCNTLARSLYVPPGNNLSILCSRAMPVLRKAKDVMANLKVARTRTHTQIHTYLCTCDMHSLFACDAGALQR